MAVPNNLCEAPRRSCAGRVVVLFPRDLGLFFRSTTAAQMRLVAARLRRSAYAEVFPERRSLFLAEAARFARVARSLGLVERAGAASAPQPVAELTSA